MSIGVGIIGYGYWGPNLVRNFAELDGAELIIVGDLRRERLELARKRYPKLAVTVHADEVIEDPRVDAVVIATPVATHFDLALKALKRGKHVWVEKPLAENSTQVCELISEADERNLCLHVDHTFVYTPAIRKIKLLVENDELGHINYYDSVRINLGLFQHDVNVFWDLAVHDLTIMDFILPESPVAVSATAMSHVKGQPENTGYITLFFSGTMIAHIHVDWLAPVKIRRLLLSGSKKMVVFDDLEPSEKIRVYDKGITITSSENPDYKMRIGYRSGDVWIPQLEIGEALANEVAYFIRCIEKSERSLTDGRAGLRVIQILEAVNESMKKMGQAVDLKPFDRS
ncbi:MAG TPA: Gfo/Idh/MocA family oxidoreductase [bacterium]|nr:Gfo/Idh/MocA family oxidoreductase [bacterium]